MIGLSSIILYYAKESIEAQGKAMILELAMKLKEQLDSGDVDPLSMAAGLRKISSFCDDAISAIQPYVEEQVEKFWKDETPTALNCKVEISYRGTYDYSHNPIWHEKKSNADKWKKELADFEEMLKRIPAGKAMVDEESGETFYGPAKRQTASIKVTIPK